LRVFLDTNVLVSAFATRGICADLLEVVLLEHDLVTGNQVLNELRKALRDKIKLPAARSAEIIEFLTGEAMVVVDHAQAIDAKVDVADARVLGQAKSAEAHVFVTGDAALLKVRRIGGLEIVSPRQFWDTLRSGTE
jgi:uncharacterized protein